MKVSTDVLLSAYSGWMMTSKSFDEVKKVYEYLEGDIMTDTGMTMTFNKWSDYLDAKYNLSRFFKDHIMPNKMDKVLDLAFRELGESVDLIK